MKIDELKGLGPKKKLALEKKGITTLWDLVKYFPINYEDRRKAQPIKDVAEGEAVLICGVVTDIKGNFKGWGKKQVLRVHIQDESGTLELVFFNGNYLSRAFKIGEVFYCYGKPSFNMEKRQMIHPEFFKKDGDKGLGIFPLYGHINGVSGREIHRFIVEALATNEIQQEMKRDYIPKDFQKKYDLLSLEEAIKISHGPKSFEELKKAQKRFLYEDMLLLCLGIEMMNEFQKMGISIAGANTDEYINSLPFKLTGAQAKVTEEILKDMASTKVMNRLLQGDVGSGKTAVAQIALYEAAKSGFQGAYMMPTEILAKQQFNELKESLGAYGIKVGYLVGSMKQKEKNKVKEDLLNRDIHIVIGTHALIQRDVEYKNLGLVITDEQHRFGVNQRSMLREKGEAPNTLVMSATPIPRTLAMVLFGDMDISTIDELPASKKPIKTKAVTGKSRDQVYSFVDEEIKKGRQGYVVAPLIEQSEALEEVKSATEIWEELVKRFPQYKVELLHGEMNADEKEDIMERFAKGKVDLLVSTVVIEVGINVQNATVMVIENSERFGLSQLHQLRGRVGRGKEQSYCLLITQGTTEIALERAKTITESNDGFYIAEKDLELRGAGDVLGSRQHGISSAHIQDLLFHMDIFDKIKPEASAILREHPGLEDKETHGLRREVDKIFEGKQGITL